ncbi:MAG TPA: tail fiber protein [Flavobacterium sp.]|jgi:microcystin-dependent protein
MDEYIGICKIFGGTYAPQNYFFCQGQLLSISQFSALFSVLGTTYGGDGVTTFALPNLAGLAPIGIGASPVSGSRYSIGERGGVESMSLSVTNMPAHVHNPRLHASSANAAYSAPKPTSVLAAPGVPEGRGFTNSYGFSDGTADITMSAASVTEDPAGASQPFKIMQPFIAMNWIICYNGLYPPRE